MALTIGEANATATLVHLLQGDARPSGVAITPAYAAQAVEDLVPKIHKALMAGPHFDEAAVRRTVAALAILPGLVDDLCEMADTTAIYLETWPNARALVEAYKPEVDS